MTRQNTSGVSARLDLMVCLPECVKISQGDLCPNGNSGWLPVYLKKKSGIKSGRFGHTEDVNNLSWDVFEVNWRENSSGVLRRCWT